MRDEIAVVSKRISGVVKGNLVVSLKWGGSAFAGVDGARAFSPLDIAVVITR
jgi:hypothetical protein